MEARELRVQLPVRLALAEERQKARGVAPTGLRRGDSREGRDAPGRGEAFKPLQCNSLHLPFYALLLCVLQMMQVRTSYAATRFASLSRRTPRVDQTTMQAVRRRRS